MRERLSREIAAGGPIPFERFMSEALYGTGGFFSSATLRSHRGGDFLTSPEVSRHFGRAIGRWAQSRLDRLGQPGLAVEVGAGSGSLLDSLLEVVAEDVPVIAVEVSPAARDGLSARSSPGARSRITIVRDIDELPVGFRGVVIANELIDNLPMAVAQMTDNGWRERWVGLEGDDQLALVDAPIRPEVAAWVERYAGDVEPGGWVEVQLAAAAWLTRLVFRMERGSILVIDYGDTAENLLPRRRDGTLRTYRAHHLGPHPLDEPGATDITADVNFTALSGLVDDLGLSWVLTRQDDFLATWGLRDLISELRHLELRLAKEGDESRRLEVRSERTEVETLLHPRGLGDFRVLEIEV